MKYLLPFCFLPMAFLQSIFLTLTFSLSVWAETLSLPESEKSKGLELKIKKESDHAASLESADGYAAKGFYYLAIHEAQKVPETSTLYSDAVARILRWSKKLQDGLSSSKDNSVIPVRNAPVFITKALFTKDTGPLEAFNLGHNNPKLALEIISVHKMTIKTVEFKVLCYDALDEPVQTNKGVYTAKVENLDMVPMRFQTMNFDLKEMGNVQRIKIKLASVQFADGTIWEAPPEIK